MAVRRACDGPSCCFRHKVQRLNSLKSLWRSVVPTTVRPAIPSWSSESRSQYPIFQNLSVLERDTLDAPSYSSIEKFRELFWVPNFSETKCFGTRPPRRSVVPMTVRRGVRRLRQLWPENKLYCSKRLTDRYNRYQFTHRSSSNDHKKKNKDEKEYLNL